jgi:hypothetical protein
MSNKKRILVCGGRHYGTTMSEDGYYIPNKQEVEKFNKCLDDVLEEFKHILIIHGSAKGADTLADKWAKANKIDIISFPADWNSYGKAAGSLRNLQMLEEGQPDLVIGFPGGTGTEMMCKIAAGADIEVRKIK